MDLLHYPLAFLAVLGILVTIHEFGHYLIARMSGVQIVRFSIGFGRPLWTYLDSRGTEFTLAMIPLGGYVRMYDDQEEGDASAIPDGAISYNELTPLWRIAIALGGPLANFVLAIFVYWVLLVVGTLEFAPVVAKPADDTVMAKAGLRQPAQILAVDGREVRGWQDVGLALTDRLGETGDIVLSVEELMSGRERTLQLPIRDWHVGVGEPDVFGSLGMQRTVLSLVGEVVPDSAAQRGGLLAGDFVTAVDGRAVADWSAWVDEVQAHPGQPLTLTLYRDGVERAVRVVPESRELEDGTEIGVVGVSMALNEVEHGALPAIPAAVGETWDKTVMILSVIKKMVVGQVSMKNLSGPISIAQVAGDSARYSWRSFMGIIGFLSVSLGIFNLLPIPLLDGGHILFNSAELVTGKPVPERIQVIGVQVGLLLVGTLMVLATYNDLLRIF